jgi:HAD superfamily hydrolase (TIGR01490 family)
VKRKLVLFDFDGTITTKDTLLEFIRFYHGSLKFLFGFALLSPVIALHLFKIIPNWKAKQFVLTWFFKGESLERFSEKCDQFTHNIIPALIRPQGLAAIRNHKQNNDEVVVISASAENWVAPWCKALGLPCIATRLEVLDGKLTGKILEKNCYGAEKVTRLLKQYKLEDFTSVTAYGDSSGDKEMLAVAHEQFYKPFRKVASR